MENIYNTPESELSGRSVPLNYASLGKWRKIFLIINWILAIGFIFSAFFSLIGINGINITQLTVSLLGFAQICWLHWAVCKRNIKHLLIIALIQLFPMLNPISCIILLVIRSTSKEEISADQAQ